MNALTPPGTAKCQHCYAELISMFSDPVLRDARTGQVLCDPRHSPITHKIMPVITVKRA